MIRHRKLLSLLVLTLACAWACAACAQSASYALLVGVSEYPSLGPERQLRGPRNDVDSMRDTLRALRSDWRRMTILADGVAGADGMPTRAAIAASLERLAHEVHAGDFVVVYFSGHGSQQPAAPGDTDEADGLDEIFLPRDIGRWDGRVGGVRNALTDNDVNRLLTPLLAAGAEVWAVFDTCHSGTMTRGVGSLLADSEVQREVRPAELGVPLFAAPRARALQAAAAGRSSWAEKLVVFSAAQSDQSTPELRLPLGDPARVEHGLFSYTLAQALRMNGATTFAQLAQSIATRYAIMQRSAPTPVFEGTLERATPFATAPATTTAVRAMPIGISEPVMCARAEQRAPCGTAGRAGDAALRADAARWLAAAAHADATLQRVSRPADADVALIVRGGRVWFVATADDYALGDREPPSAADAATFAADLRAIANVQRLFRLAERPSAPAALTVSLQRAAARSAGSCGAAGVSLPMLGPPQVLRGGDPVCLIIRNGGAQPLDVTLLHVGADYGVEPLFPQRNETNRIAAGAERRIALQIVAEDAPVMDRILALAAAAQGEDIVDFSWLSQPGVESRTRGIGAATSPLSIQTLRWISAPAR